MLATVDSLLNLAIAGEERFNDRETDTHRWFHGFLDIARRLYSDRGLAKSIFSRLLAIPPAPC
jgi:hypothetical protein